MPARARLTPRKPAPAAPAAPDLEKAATSRQVLFHRHSPLAGPHWADLPVHSVIPTPARGDQAAWDELAAYLDANDLDRYGIPAAASDGDAVMQARRRWENEGPYAAWFAFLHTEAPAIEAMRAEYEPTPEQERAAFEFATAATGDPAAPFTVDELHALVSGPRAD